MKRIIKNHEQKKMILIIFLIILSVNGIIFFSKFIGYVAYDDAKAGTITEIDVRYQEPAYSWSGVYGVSFMVPGYPSQQYADLLAAGMKERNPIFPCLEPDVPHEIYALTIDPATLPLSFWESAMPGTAADVDDYLGLNGNEWTSAAKTFTDTLTIRLGSRTLTLPAVYTVTYDMSNNKTFGVGILKSGTDLVFVANIAEFASGFNNVTYNYQMILPILNMTTTRYYFIADPYDECPAGLGYTGGVGNLFGTVSSSTGVLLEGVVVSIEGQNVVTDSNGYYNITIPFGVHTIAAFKENYETYAGNVTIEIGNTTEHNIIMNPSNTFNGPGQTDFTNVNIGPGTSTKTKTNDDVGPSVGPSIGPYLEEPKNIEGQDFIVSIPTINRRLKIDNFIEESISIYSFKDGAVTLDFSIEGNVSDLIELEKDRMVLGSRSNDVLKLRIFGRGTLGVYNGTLKISGSVNENIPIRIELTDKDLLEIQALFVDLETITPIVHSGEVLQYKTTLRNLLTDTGYPVYLFYKITDKSGDKVISVSSENLNLKTTFSLLKSEMLSKTLLPGDYVITVQASYLDLTSTVSTTFKVTLPFYQYMVFGKVPLWWIFAAIAVILLITGLSYWYYKNLQSKKKYHLKVDYNEIPKPGPRNIYVGKISETDNKTYFNLENFKVHTIVAGTTGGGKSFSAQGIIEEMLLHNVAVIVFDPTAQWTGFLRKLQSKSLLSLYSSFGMKITEARAFNGNIRMIRDAKELIDIKKYMKPGEIQIFACHKLDPKDMDIYVSNAIKEVFHGNFNESPELRLMIVFDEIHRILPKFGGSGAGFLQIERGCREFRKWGIGIMLISQVLGDFMGEIKANINTEIQMRTRDEGDLERISTRYGKDVLQSLVKATVGSGMIENPAYNRGKPYFVSFKPIMHSVERLSDEDIEKYNKYNGIIDQIEYELKQLEEEEGQDVFDMKLELKLALDKVKGGNFNMVDIYLEGLTPRIEKLWQKLGKKPKKYKIKLVSDADLAADLAKAKAEKIKAEEEEKKKKAAEGVSTEETASKPKELTVLDIRTSFLDAFTFANGQQVTTLQEFIDVLPSIGPAEYAKSVNKDKNDIADWLKTKFGVPELAEKIRPIIDHDELLAAIDYEVKKPMKIKEIPKPQSSPSQSAPQAAPQPAPLQAAALPPQVLAQKTTESQLNLEERKIEANNSKTLEQKVESKSVEVNQTPISKKEDITVISSNKKTWKEIKPEYEKILLSTDKIKFLLLQENNLPSEPNIKYALAIEYHKLKDYKNAESKYLSTLSLLPNNPKVLGYLNAVRDAMAKETQSEGNAQNKNNLNVNPSNPLSPSQYFKLSDGTEIKSYVELKDAIRRMDENMIKQYVNQEKNEFAVWVESALSDKDLADKLRHAHTKSELEAALS